MIKLKNLLDLIVKSSLKSFLIIFIDFIFLFLIFRNSSNVSSSLSLVILLEGGLCFVIGGGAVLYSPLFAKLQEVFFQSKPYTATNRKKIETQMQTIIILGLFLVFYGLIISLF
jgi:hypothetical protein